MKIKIKEIALFGMLGALMYASKLLMEVLPNIHLLATFTVAFTVLFRRKALWIIYIYVLILGVISGFATFWVMHLYVWTALWAVVMLLPKNMSPKIAPIVYMIVAAIHGFLYGVLCSPVQAAFFGLDFKGTIAWIISGIPFDLIHGVSNFLCGILIYPIVKALKRIV